MTWLAEWIVRRTEPKDPAVRERYYRVWGGIIFPAVCLYYVWRWLTGTH